MGDDAEYWIEQQAEELAFEQFGSRSSGLKSLACWLDDVEDEVWSWAPGSRVSEWIYLLYRDLKIGSDFFLAKRIYHSADSDIHPPAQDLFRVIDDVVYELASDPDKARFEVIVISGQELKKVKQVADRLKIQASSLKEECFAEMVAEIAVFMENESPTETFTFHMKM